MKNIIRTAKKNYFKLLFKLSENDFIAAGVRGDKKKVQWYIDNGVDIDAGYKDGTNLLHYLSIAQDNEMIDLLIKNKANLNMPDAMGNTPLNIIAKNSSDLRPDSLSGPVLNPEEKNKLRKEKSFLIAKNLIENGANIDTSNRDGYTPLIFACYKENEKLVNLFLEHNADVFVINKKEFNALKYAVNYKNIDIVNTIIGSSKNNDELDRHCKTIAQCDYPYAPSLQEIVDTMRLKMKMEDTLTVKPYISRKKI